MAHHRSKLGWRKWWPVAPLAFVAACLATSWSTAADAAANQLPLKRIVLFNSGVGFFEHRAEINGDAAIDLKFNVDDVNDLLKSMVLQDLGGGKVSTVTYGSKDPITKTLKTFSIDLTDNPTMAKLLDQVRGEEVSLQASNEIVGTILGVEVRKQRVNKDEVIDVEYLNLLTPDGLRSVPLEQVMKIKLTNGKLDAELRQALAILALGHATDKKTVTLNFVGEGKRPVQVGYIQEAPIWKTSYRLVLDDKQSPLLQGWAIVENTTEEDWNDVELTLVSGRPISFVMNLYDPLYVPRPKVDPELFASLRPQKYEEDLASREKVMLGVAATPTPQAAPPAPAGMGGGMARSAARGSRRSGVDSDGNVALSEPAVEAYFDQSPRLEAEQVASSVRSAAETSDVGELFQYAIDTPVVLERQRSAMLPIVNGPVEAQKVSIYDPATHAKHPLNGLKLKNTTSLHLMQGPITVFDGGTYAGDAQIADLPPGSERLVSYALDLDTEVAPEAKPQPEQLTSVRLLKGVLESSRKLTRRVDYTVKNAGDKPKQVLISYPHDPSWKLVKPAEPNEKTRDAYRFAVAAEPGKPARLEIEEEQVVGQQIGLANLDENTIVYYINSKVVSPAVKAALQEVVRRRQLISTTANEQQQVTTQIQAISEEQGRIRQNMERLERNSELYGRYTKKLNSQEDEIETFRAKLEKLVATLTEQQKSLDEYLLGLDLK